MLDSYFHPYSHSLITAVIWSGQSRRSFTRRVCGRHPFDSAQGRLSDYSKSAPLIIGLASLLALDSRPHCASPRPRRSTITHGRSDLVCGIIATRSLRWRSRCSPAASLLYLTRNAMPAIRKGAVIAFGLVLVIVQIGDTYVPRTPLTDKATVTGVWVFYTLFVVIAFARGKDRASETKLNAP